MISYLKGSKMVKVIDKKLSPALPIDEFKANLPGTLDALLLWKFDNQHCKEFQKILRIASVIGREFSLDEVAAILCEDPEKSISRTIQRLGCLIKIFDYEGILEARDKLSVQGSAYLFNHPYAFTDSEMKDVIYNERVSLADKQSMHLKLVQFYETKITSESEPTFIPRICYHYSYTGVSDRDSILNHIRYMVMLGNYLCLSAEMYKEVLVLYSTIQKMIEEHDLEDVLGPNLISEIHIRLGHAYNHGLPHEINRIQSLRHIMIAINVLDFGWPKSDSQWIALLTRELTTWGFSSIVKVFRNPKKNRVKHENFRKRLIQFFGGDIYSRDQKIDRLEHLQPILENMSKNLYETDARLREQICCDLLVLNNAFRMGNYTPKGGKLLLSFATKFWFAGYKGFALRIAESMNDTEMDSQTYALGALFWTVVCRWETARIWAQSGMELSQKIGTRK